MILEVGGKGDEWFPIIASDPERQFIRETMVRILDVELEYVIKNLEVAMQALEFLALEKMSSLDCQHVAQDALDEIDRNNGSLKG
tara:strand:+ start:432 stop:686 length:255 start_codon:yes stop_codon:yes gene_type:complete